MNTLLLLAGTVPHFGGNGLSARIEGTTNENNNVNISIERLKVRDLIFVLL
jgi:hypothetical protein